MKKKIKIALVDDHRLFRSGVSELIHKEFEGFEVIQEADHGVDFLKLLESEEEPDVALIDINMSVMDGFETVEQLQQKHPSIRILVVTMNTDNASLLRMIRLGVNGYLGKDIESDELRMAIEDMYEKGTHYNEKVTKQLVRALRFPSEYDGLYSLKKSELEFLKLSCSEDTYEQIADKMFKSVKTIDGYRASVFQKLNAKSRVGMVIQAIRAGIVQV